MIENLGRVLETPTVIEAINKAREDIEHATTAPFGDPDIPTTPNQRQGLVNGVTVAREQEVGEAILRELKIVP